MSTRTKLLLSSMLVGIGAALGAAPAAAQEATTEGCIADFDPSASYFPAETTIEEAENVSIDYFGSYKVITVDLPYPGGAPQTYVLVQCGAPTPEVATATPGAVVVHIPVRAVYAASGPGLFAALDRIDAIAGVPWGEYLYNAEVRAGIAEGRIVEFSPNFQLDLERVLAGMPDLYVTGGTEDPLFARFLEAGIPVVSAAAYLEPTALGQAEWVKFIAAFFNDEARADAIFDDVQDRYAEVAARAAVIPEAERPLVLVGSAYQGVFYAAGGQSYVAQMIEAAGGRYVFAEDQSTASMQVPELEVVIDRAGDAAYWLNVSAPSVASAVADEPRLGGLAAVASGELWQYDRISNGPLALDYFERGPLRPDLVLSDMMKIFHPDLMTDYAFEFYRRLPLE